jgi:hypothetical protein
MNDVKNNTNLNIFNTHFENMMPQKGFLTSSQSLIPIIDIDLTYENHFILKIIQEESIPYFFVENGPLRINPYQEFFIIEAKDKETFNYLNSCNFYEIKNYSILNNKTSFVEHSFEKKIIPFEKEVKENKFIYKINLEISKILEKKDVLIFGNGKNINPLQDPKLYIDHSKSIKRYITEGLPNIILEIDKIFKDLNLSGKLYKTRNGLRIILNDKFRNLLDINERQSSLKLMKTLMMDETFLSMYVKSENPLNTYLARLTPKLKNYKYFDDSYKDIFTNLHSINLESLFITKNIKPIKYDFNKLTYLKNKGDEFIDKSFDILRNIIFQYLKNDSFAVCSLIKSYNFSEENSIINDYIYYHDRWTKANLTDVTLI